MFFQIQYYFLSDNLSNIFLQHVITIQENQAGLSFLEFVRNLNFIVNIEPVQVKKKAKTKKDKLIPLAKKNGDFFELFGIWKDSDINIETEI